MRALYNTYIYVSTHTGKFVTVHAMKACRKSEGIAPVILSLGCSYTEVTSIAFRQLYPRKEPSLQ
jgi:hypothetical protein